MSSAFNLAKKVILTKRKSKAYVLNMVDVYYAAGRLTDEEYQELVELIETTYED